jgi:hypothetical protein
MKTVALFLHNIYARLVHQVQNECYPGKKLFYEAQENPNLSSQTVYYVV